MLSHNLALYQTLAIRELERIAIEDYHMSELTLMERAGAAALMRLRQRWPKSRNIVVLCGKGNNGGDGYILARLAHTAGLSVRILQLASITELKGAALTAALACQKGGVPMAMFHAASEWQEADVVVDALFGTGLKKEIKGIYRKAIAAINLANKSVLALDVPSGLDADTGEILGVAVRAEATVTFVGLKAGLFTNHGLAYCGEITCDDLGIPLAAVSRVIPVATLINFVEVQKSLPRRRRDTHKGDFGHVLVIGGDYGMGGATRMAAEAAARIGAGLTTVATHPEHVPLVSGQRPELMCHAVQNVADLKPLLEKATVIVLGPGLGQSQWSQELYQAALAAPQPKIIDADGLNLLAQNPQRQDHWILTPHPGEAGRLLASSAAGIQANRYAAIKELQARYGGISVLKGAGTLIKGDNSIGVCPLGNPGMATGGMGDVLSGVIGGLVAQGLDLETAARVGVYIHAQAADRAALEGGERGLLALDLMPYLKRLVNGG